MCIGDFKRKLQAFQNKNGKKTLSAKSYRPIIGLTIISLLICGLLFPLVVTGVAQAIFPNQANGEIVTFHGQKIGSNLIDNNFTLPIFFHARPANDSASGVDPDITVPEAISEIPRIQNATGIPAASLEQIVDQNIEGVYFGIFGSPYVNVLKLNLVLIQQFPSVYKAYGS